MKKVIALLVWCFAAIVVAPQAHADEVSFAQDMNEAGFTNGDGIKAEVAVGMSICAALLAGDTEQHQAHKLYVESQMTSQDEAQQFVRIAIKDLCP